LGGVMNESGARIVRGSSLDRVSILNSYGLERSARGLWLRGPRKILRRKSFAEDSRTSSPHAYTVTTMKLSVTPVKWFIIDLQINVKDPEIRDRFENERKLAKTNQIWRWEIIAWRLEKNNTIIYIIYREK